MVNYTKIIGILLILLSYVMFIFFSYWIVLSKFQNSTNVANNDILTFLQNDRHFCLIFPIIVPLSFIFLYFRYIHYNIFKRA